MAMSRLKGDLNIIIFTHMPKQMQPVQFGNWSVLITNVSMIYLKTVQILKIVKGQLLYQDNLWIAKNCF